MINIVEYTFLNYLSSEMDNKITEYTQQHKHNYIKLQRNL